MSRRGWWLLAFVLIMTILVGSYIFFVKTGGLGLYRVVRYYLFQDLADKKYSWQDFTDRGVGKGISGFYAFGNENGFSMWTLSGLKTFDHVADTSVYQHEDVCSAVRVLRDGAQATGSAVKALKTVTGDLSLWQSEIQPENLVTVLRLTEGEHSNEIDKVWSYSGKYKELNKLDKDSCE